MQRGLINWTPGFPWRDLDRIFDDGLSASDFMPAVDVRQDKDNVIVETSVPGIDPNKINVSVENDVLTISGSTEDKKETKREDYYRKEIREGSFTRSIILPMGVKADKAKADYNKGILTLTLPKAEEAKPKKIAIKVK